MPETHPPTRTTKKSKEEPHGPVRDPRKAGVGVENGGGDEQSIGVGFAAEEKSSATEHKAGRTGKGAAR